MGTKVGPAEDALPFRKFNEKWIASYVKYRQRKLPRLDHALMVGDFQQAVAEHSADRAHPSQPWGWKRPSTMYLLPFLDEHLPGMTFLHVVRNGLDIAFSSHRYALRRFGTAVLSHAYDHEPEPLRSLRLWMTAHTTVADYGENRMGPRYVRVHYEVLCTRPVETIAALFDALGFSADPVAAAALVANPGTIGRWRTHWDARLLLRLFRVGEPALRRFGYWNASDYRAVKKQVGPIGSALMPVEELAWRARHPLLRVARAARERRLRAAVRNTLARWARSSSAADIGRSKGQGESPGSNVF